MAAAQIILWFLSAAIVLALLWLLIPKDITAGLRKAPRRRGRKKVARLTLDAGEPASLQDFIDRAGHDLIAQCADAGIEVTRMRYSILDRPGGASLRIWGFSAPPRCMLYVDDTRQESRLLRLALEDVDVRDAVEIGQDPGIAIAQRQADGGRFFIPIEDAAGRRDWLGFISGIAG